MVFHDFWFKNVGATCQRAMNLIFHELSDIIVDVYIDDIVVKSNGLDFLLADLSLTFGVSASKFLGSIIHDHDIYMLMRRIMLLVLL
jgi:hypothetical protein